MMHELRINPHGLHLKNYRTGTLLQPYILSQGQRVPVLLRCRLFDLLVLCGVILAIGRRLVSTETKTRTVVIADSHSWPSRLCVVLTSDSGCPKWVVYVLRIADLFFSGLGTGTNFQWLLRWHLILIRTITHQLRLKE